MLGYVNEAAGRAASRDVDQVQTVKTFQPDVGHEQVGWSGDQAGARGPEIGAGLDFGEGLDGIFSGIKGLRVGIDDQDVSEGPSHPRRRRHIGVKAPDVLEGSFVETVAQHGSAAPRTPTSNRYNRFQVMAVA